MTFCAPTVGVGEHVAGDAEAPRQRVQIRRVGFTEEREARRGRSRRRDRPASHRSSCRLRRSARRCESRAASPAASATTLRAAPSAARVVSASFTCARSMRCSVDHTAPASAPVAGLPTKSASWPKPFWFATNSVRSSALSASALGAQPVGINPSRCRCSGSRASITAIAFEPGQARRTSAMRRG